LVWLSWRLCAVPIGIEKLTDYPDLQIEALNLSDLTPSQVASTSRSSGHALNAMYDLMASTSRDPILDYPGLQPDLGKGVLAVPTRQDWIRAIRHGVKPDSESNLHV